MRVGIIRGDLPGSLFLGDLEIISQYDPAIEAPGQTYYVTRPTMAEVAYTLAGAVHGAGATLEGGNISGTLPITITALNQTLAIRNLATLSYTSVLVPTGVYATLASLVAAINTVLPSAFVARLGVTTGTIAIEATLRGINSWLQVAAVATSTFNVPANFPAVATIRTMPTATDYIAVCNPIGGPLDVSVATINGVGAGTSANALGLIPVSRGATDAMADAIATHLIETPVAVMSVATGSLFEYLNPNYNPDSRLVPPLPNGAAIAIVEDDGVTPYVVPPTFIATAVIGGGNLTITGTGLGSNELINATTVKIVGAVNKTVEQAAIKHAGGTVAQNLVILPLSVIAGVAAGTCTVQIKYRSLASNVVTIS